MSSSLFVRRVLLSAFAVALSIGCGSRQDPVAQEEEEDAGIIDAGYGVRGTRRNVFRRNGVDVFAPIPDLESALSFWSLADGGVTPMPVTSPAPGEFFIEGAPEGNYILKVGSNYVVRDARHLNLDFYFLGTADAGFLLGTETGTVSLTNMSSSNLTAENGQLQLLSGTAGLGTYLYLDTLPDAGTVVNATGGMGGGAFGAALPDDELWLCELAQTNNPPLNYTYQDSCLRTTSTPMTRGESFHIEGAMVPTTPASHSFDWKATEFDALRTQVHPQATQGSRTFGFTLSAAGLSDGWIGYNGELFSGKLSASVDAVQTFNMPNPFPTSWGVFGTITHNFNTPTRLPGTTAGGIGGLISERAPLSVIESKGVRPLIRPAQNFRVDGSDASTAQTLSTLTPTFTWEPASAGLAPTAYELRIHELGVNGVTTVRVKTTIWLVLEPSVTLLPGALESGKSYAASLRSVHQEQFDSRSYIFGAQMFVEGSSADTMSGILTAP